MSPFHKRLKTSLSYHCMCVTTRPSAAKAASGLVMGGPAGALGAARSVGWAGLLLLGCTVRVRESNVLQSFNGFFKDVFGFSFR